MRSKRPALALARQWESIARDAREGFLSKLSSRQLFERWVPMISGEAIAEVPSVEIYFREWLASKSNTGITASSVVRYKSVVTGFLEFLPDNVRRSPLSRLTTSHIDWFRDAERESGKSATSSNFAVKVVRAVLNRARKKGILLTNPAEGCELPDNDSSKRQPFTEEQLRRLLGVCDNEWLGMVLFGVHTGIRLSDCAALGWANIDAEHQLLCYTAAKTGRETKVPLHSDLVHYLERIPAGDDPNAPLFPSLAGKESGGGNGLSAAFGKLLVRAGIDCHPGAKKPRCGRQLKALSFHSLRHTAASRLANSGVPIDTRKNILGHLSSSVHEKYTHSDLSRETAAISQQPSLL